jgi:hypothetical protein
MRVEANSPVETEAEVLVPQGDSDGGEVEARAKGRRQM